MPDSKAGWSSMCRRGDFRQCQVAQARCANPKHKGRQLGPPAREDPPSPSRAGTEPKEKIMAAPVVEWADPPPDSRGQRNHITAEQLAEFQAHPKRWGIVKRLETKGGGNSAATSLRKGKNGVVRIDPAQWEFTQRREGSGSVLYARYLGEDPAE